MMVKELVFGPEVSQGTLIKEKHWDAITVEVTGLYVFVHDTDGNPLAAVSATLNSHETASGLDGIFSFLDIEPGDYTLTCTKEGYKDYSKDISLAGGRKDLDIKMLREDEEESWWEKFKDWWAGLETWEKGTIVGSGGALLGGIVFIVTRRKGE